MEANFDPRDTSLALGLGYPSSDHSLPRRDPLFKLEPSDGPSPILPSLALNLQAQPYESAQVRLIPQSNPATKSSSSSLVSSFSKAVSDEDEDGSARKKLRLTKDQSALLEERFKDHTTLNPKQKQALAKQLNLRPRQVEVWFQNRRARTKMKQTEAECEALKRRYERLAEENRSLQRELREMKALKLHFPFYMQSPAGAVLTMCPSCNSVYGGSYIDGSPGSSPVGLPPPTKPRLLKAFTHSSAF